MADCRFWVERYFGGDLVDRAEGGVALLVGGGFFQELALWVGAGVGIVFGLLLVAGCSGNVFGFMLVTGGASSVFVPA